MKSYLKVLKNTEVFVKGELLTPTELTKAINKYQEHMKVPTKQVNVKEENIYYCFGARFDKNDEI